MTIIRPARFPDDAAPVAEIWREFIARSPVDLAYQDNGAEFADLPGKYRTPGGGVLLADRDGCIGGCIAFRRVDADLCEMKRLFVRPAVRGVGIGRALAAAAIVAAREAGYREMRLDVQERSVVARRLYAALGFVDADPVSFNPMPGASFLGLRL